MKKIYLLIALATGSFTKAQYIYSTGLSGFAEGGWTQTNQSTSVGNAALWLQGNPSVFSAYTGGGNSYASSNYNAVAGTGTISNWLMSPIVELRNGDVLSFYTRCASNLVADRLEFRISTLGGATIVPSGGPNAVGSFTTLAVSVNPNLQQFTYPEQWTQYSYTVTGLTGPTNSKMAFRYYVTDGGLTGTNSNYIGVDEVLVYRSLLASDSFASTQFKVYPNPTADFVQVENRAGSVITEVEVIDSSGRSVKTSTTEGNAKTELSLGDLVPGVYYLKMSSADGSGISKIVRK